MALARPTQLNISSHRMQEPLQVPAWKQANNQLTIKPSGKD